MADLGAITSLGTKIKENQNEAIENGTEDTNTGLGAITSLGSKLVNDAQMSDTPEQIANNNTEAGIYTVPGVNDQLDRQIDTPEMNDASSGTTQGVNNKPTPSTDVTRPQEGVVVDNKTTPTAPTNQSTTTQETKIEASKANPEPTQEQKNALALKQFNDALDKGATQEDIQLFVRDNPDLLEDIKVSVKNHFKNASNVEFFNKYSTYSAGQLYDAKNNGEFVIGDEQYALLSPEQKAKFEEYDALERAKNNLDEDSDDVVSIDTIKNQSNYVNEINSFFSSSARENIEKITNSSQYKDVEARLTAKQGEIDAINTTMKHIGDEIRSIHKGVPANVINGIISDQTKNLNKQKDTLINEYNGLASTYKNLQNKVDIELKLSQIEDTNNKWVYEQALNQYNTDRNNMTDLAIKEFEAQNKILAEDIKHQRTLEIKAFEAQLKKEEKGGVYKTDREGKLLYVVDGVSKEVTSTLGDVVFTEVNETFKDTTYNNDGVFTTIRTYDNGGIDYFTHSADGSSTSTMSVYDAISGIPTTGLQCGEAVNKYVSSLGVSPQDFWVGDSYESKAKYIDETIDIPQPGYVAIWDNGAVDSATGTDNGHIGIVTGPVQADGMVEITDWNINGEETKSTRMVDIKTIKNSDGGFYNPAGYTEGQKSFLEGFDGKVTSTTLDTMKKLGLSVEDAYAYKSGAITEADKLQIGQATNMISSLKGMLGEKRGHRMTSGLIQYSPFFGDNEADLRADFNYLKGTLTLQNLLDLKAGGATFGALSNEELGMIADSATRLSMNLSNEKWDEEVKFLIQKFEDIMTRAGGKVEVEAEPITFSDAEILENYNKKKATIDVSYLN